MYSQCDEERYILDTFQGTVGTFLDIGALDGKTGSNTLALVERGWSGVLVEPSPNAFLALQKRHGKNFKLHLIHAAIGLSYGLTKFWEDPQIEGFATTEECNRAKWEHHVKFPAPYFISTVPVSLVLAMFPPNGPDFLSLDTEGNSVDLFREFPFTNDLRPRMVCVEHDERIPECLTVAEAWRYREIRPARNPQNMLLVRCD